MNLRPIRPADLEGVLDLWEALLANGRAADPRFEPASDARAQMRERARDRWFPRDPFPHVLVAESDGRLIGFIHVFPFSTPILNTRGLARIGDLWVDPDFRRIGLGRRLVESVCQFTGEAGYPELEVGTLTADHRAVAFWHAMGFGDWQVTMRFDHSR